MRERGKNIFIMNKIRLCILRNMWNDQKRLMIQNLKKPTKKKKENLRKKRLGSLMRLGDDVREVCLKSYFTLCKEKAAKKFINWRIQ